MITSMASFDSISKNQKKSCFFLLTKPTTVTFAQNGEECESRLCLCERCDWVWSCKKLWLYTGDSRDNSIVTDTNDFKKVFTCQTTPRKPAKVWFHHDLFSTSAIFIISFCKEKKSWLKFSSLQLLPLINNSWKRRSPLSQKICVTVISGTMHDSFKTARLAQFAISGHEITFLAVAPRQSTLTCDVQHCNSSFPPPLVVTYYLGI